MLSKLLEDLEDREEEGSIFIDADSLLYSASYLHRENWDIELAYMTFMERIGSIRSECYTKVAKLNDLIIGFTSKTNFRYEIYPEYKANRSKNTTEESRLLVERTKELKRLIYKRVKGLCEASTVWEADDLAIQYADKGYMVGAIDKDVVNACRTPCYNYKKGKWDNHKTDKDIERWYLIQSIAGDATDNIKGSKGMGIVKSTNFVDELLSGKKDYEQYLDLFESYEEALLMNQLVRMDMYDDNGDLKLMTMEDLLAKINPF